MSILYIGPYRQNDYAGFESSIYLRSIAKSVNAKNLKLYARPYYSRVDVGIHTNEYDHLENLPESFSFPDTIVQHAIVDHISIQPSSNNIIIPILSNRLHKTSKYSIIQKLNYCNHIIVFDETEKNLLLKSNINRPIHICNLNLLDSISDPQIFNRYYNYGDIQKKYNFVFIGEYIHNLEIIQTIVFAFIIAHRRNSNIGLTLVLRGNEQNKQDIEQFNHKICQQLKIAHRPEIRLQFSELKPQDIYASLNSADCLLSFNQDYSHRLYENYILSQNKLCLSYKNTDYNINPTTNPAYEYSIYDTIKTINIDSLVNNIIQAKDKKNNKIDKKNKYDNLGKIICNLIS